MTAPHYPARTDRPTAHLPAGSLPAMSRPSAYAPAGSLPATSRSTTVRPTTNPPAIVRPAGSNTAGSNTAGSNTAGSNTAGRAMRSTAPAGRDATVLLPPPAEDAEDEPRFTLSATQVMASMAAAVTAALVGSKLGVAGTVVGAGLASVISVVGSAIFGHSIFLTRKQVQRAVLQVRGAEGAAPDVMKMAGTPGLLTLPAASAAPPVDAVTVVIPAVKRTQLTEAARVAAAGPERNEPSRPYPTRPNRRRVRTGVLLGMAAAVAIFASSLGALTILETIKGSPLGGGQPGALSVLGGKSGTTNDAPASPTTVEVTEQQTVTQTVSTTAERSSTSGSVQSSPGSAPTTPSPAPTTPSPAPALPAPTGPASPTVPTSADAASRATGAPAAASTAGQSPGTTGGSAP